MEEKIIHFLRNKDYVFIKNIGRGGLGQTVLLKDDTIDQLFVCKKYAPIEGIDKKIYFKNFINEIKLMHLLNNKNVVRVFNYYLYTDQYTGYILMEYIKDDEINHYIHENPDKINGVFIQAIDGFCHLEECNVLHRDIRETNILISNDGIVKIIDLGFGKQLLLNNDSDKSISLNWWCETPDEFKKNKYDKRTEVYFVGKLFEKIINDNGIDTFQFISELRNMITLSPDNRTQSFHDIASGLIMKNEIIDSFTDDEQRTYQLFADELDKIFAKVESSSQYINSPEKIIHLLEESYRKNMLEGEVKNNIEIANAFISGMFSFYRSTSFSVYWLKEFIKILKNSNSEKQKIIMLNIQNRLDLKQRYVKEDDGFADDIPF